MLEYPAFYSNEFDGYQFTVPWISTSECDPHGHRAALPTGWELVLTTGDQYKPEMPELPFPTSLPVENDDEEPQSLVSVERRQGSSSGTADETHSSHLHHRQSEHLLEKEDELSNDSVKEEALWAVSESDSTYTSTLSFAVTMDLSDIAWPQPNVHGEPRSPQLKPKPVHNPKPRPQLGQDPEEDASSLEASSCQSAEWTMPVVVRLVFVFEFWCFLLMTNVMCFQVARFCSRFEDTTVRCLACY